MKITSAKKKNTKPLLTSTFIFILILALSACSSITSSNRRYPLQNDKPPSFRINVNKIPNAVPKTEPLSKRGNPKSYVVFGRRYYVMKSAKGYHAKGIASWYGMKFQHFQTANGDIYNVAGMTAAHKTLPLPTYLQVTNLRNGKKIIVKVNDRGPFVNNRLIDLSYAAAIKLDMTGTGTAPVTIQAITPGITRLATNARNFKPFLSTQNKNQPYIHLGLFKQRAQALKLALLVKHWTRSSVKVEKTPIHKRLYYRVVIGPLPNTKSTKQLHRQLQLAGLQSYKEFN
ncbi:MAG: septal ring lytic transglycosylase RlpA family protein [Rickettsiella sp.]|nr:septal ring lytic transglycosylase RlpA family protein [Rickettsiella sp.]